MPGQAAGQGGEPPPASYGAAAGAAAAGALATDAADADADAGGVVIGRRPGPETVLRPRFLSAAAATFDDDFLRG
mgnify:CR=1 FL=1